MTAIAIAAQKVSRSYGHFTVLHDINLDIKAGEFVSLVGPSGCGKTTLLRILGGFDRPSAGSVHLDGQDVTDVPPERRHTNMVFQRGALFPHLTVAENIGYPLKRMGVAATEIKRRVDDMLSLIRLPGFGERRPAELSGGQAQRVALARGLIGRPKVLLLDEPFSALDLSLRKELQLELKRIHREFGCAFVFVTHDQEEALVLSDRIVIMNKGHILQDGSPKSIYREPADVFAAQFIGEMNLLPGKLKMIAGDRSTVEIGRRTVDASSVLGTKIGDPVLLSIRPENIIVKRSDSEDAGVVDEVIYVGNRWRVRVTCPQMAQSLWTELPVSSDFEGIVRGDRISLALSAEHSRLLPAQ